MITSMTGFGRRQGTAGEATVTIEVFFGNIYSAAKINGRAGGHT
jgi:hypothetical protein